MAASSSGSRRYDVFPSFRGEDVRTTFLSHLLMALDGRSIKTFRDHGIERSLQIAPELLLAIRESSISIVVFSKNYASSTWCLNELVEIHKCFTDLGQMVIPVFYDVDPSDVRKQTGEFGKVFEVTCKDKTEDEKQSWIQALEDVANMAGEDLRNGPDEAHVVKKIADDVSNKLISPSNSFGDLVGIEAHLEAMKSVLCMESEEARMVGIWGTSGIGKSTIGRALFSQLLGQFPLRNFVTYRKSTVQDVSGMKSSWEQEFLSEILGQKDIKIEHFGVVEKRLQDKKVLIVLDDVNNHQGQEFLKTLVGKTEWFGPGSRIIVITQDRRLLKAHDIDLLYEVKLPSQDLALKMLCRSAFEQDSPPDDFKELAVEVATLAGNLPLGLSVLGSSLRRREKKEWMKLLPELQSLDGDIMKTLRISYDRLAKKNQDIFHYIACFFNGKSVESINDFLGDGNTGLETLADKSLIRITPDETVEMHNLLEKLATEIDGEESKGNPGKCRFLDDAEEILDVFTDKTGTETVLGVLFYAFSPSQIKKPFISIDEKSFEGMRNLQFLEIHDHWEPSERRLRLPNGLVYLPRKLKWLEWNNCPLRCLPSNFKAQHLVELRMKNSELEKLWEGTQLLGSLKKIIMRHSKYLKEIPDLSKAINLKEVDLFNCEELESFPTPLNSEFLEYLNLLLCPRLKNYPEIIMQSSSHGIRIEVKDYLWNKNLPGLDYLDCFTRCNPSKFRPEHLVRLRVKGNMLLEKLWEGVQSLGSLVWMDLSDCGNLTEIPDLSKATNLQELTLSNCKILVMLPSTIGNLQNLVRLEMEECIGLEVLPVDVNLSSLKILNLRGCSSLRSFPQISSSIETLNLDDTAIEEVPCYVKNLSRLRELNMHGCKKLKNISPNIFSLTSLKEVDFTDCGGVITALSDATVVATMEDHYENIEKRNNVEKRRTHNEDVFSSWYGRNYFNFQNCFKLDGDMRELILRSCFKWNMVVPGGEVPTYFEHRAYGNSLTVTLPQSSLSHEFLRFKACVVVEPLTDSYASMKVHIHFNGRPHIYRVQGIALICKTDHLVLCSCTFRPTGLPSKLDFNYYVEFKFSGLKRIKECGIRFLNVSPYPDDSDESSKTVYNQQSGEKCNVVETESSKKRKRLEPWDIRTVAKLMNRGQTDEVTYPAHS